MVQLSGQTTVRIVMKASTLDRQMTSKMPWGTKKKRKTKQERKFTAHICNPSAWEANARQSGVQGHSLATQ